MSYIVFMSVGILLNAAFALAFLRWEPLKNRRLQGWWHVVLAAGFAILLIVFLLVVR